jgi:hypothetical protein
MLEINQEVIQLTNEIKKIAKQYTEFDDFYVDMKDKDTSSKYLKVFRAREYARILQVAAIEANLI